ncbi:MAG TPA: BTAD domain-containing putative transcriptional regulator, partial [Gemmatimonadaceae bacterium]|nr:BTAD domain-containing putative transcriptional regulator [Gemmatimonadaceae bacterium]
MSATTASYPAPLPSSLTSFIGREREVGEVGEALAAKRLVTLTGAGGSGKTRLAAEVARAAERRFANGVAWIELASIAEPSIVAANVATMLGVDGGGRSHADALCDALRDADILLVMDNCEHLIEACASLVDRLLRECRQLRILATSREPLGIPGERAWLVPVLSLPASDAAPESISSSEAVRLFIDRARAASTSFALTGANAAAVAALCTRLDGLPLAIELAAARVRALTPSEILARLDDGLRVIAAANRTGIPRHRTLREAIGWSYDLLDEGERLLLQRLSVFAGEFALDAAEAICAGGCVASEDVLELLAALVDKSLVVVRDQVDEVRYRLLETVRQFAREQLDTGTGAAVVRVRHASFYASLIREAEPHLITRQRPAWVDRLYRELDDLRLVLTWSREHDTALHAELAGRLGWFWYSSGLWTEGRGWLEDALPLTDAVAAPADRARVLFGAGVVASLQGHGSTARAWLDESAALARAIGDRSLAAYSDSYIGVALGQSGLATAEAPARSALEWFDETGDLYGKRLALVVLATLRIGQGNLEDAHVMSQEAVRVARLYGLGRELGIAYQIAGTVLLHQRRLDGAAQTIGEALRALRGDPQAFWIARAIELMGVIESARGQPVHATRLFGAAEARRERMGAAMFLLDRERLAPHIAAAREALGGGAFAEAWRAGRATPFDEAIDIAIANAARSGAVAARSVQAAPRDNPEPDSVALRVRALGPLEIIRDGVPVPDAAWKYARPRELFMYLLVHERGRTRSEIGLAFWPDASPAQLKNNFHVMLHQLRRTLGRAELVVFEGDRYRVNRALGVELDAEAFEREIVAARRAVRASPRSPEALERIRDSLAIYRGDFLSHESVGDWHLELRDRLQRLWLDGMAALGDGLMEAAAYDDAVAVYRRIVSADELNEDAHRQLMAALARVGHRGEALRHYDRLAAILRRELDAEPDDQTTQLYDKLRIGV